MEKDFKGAIVSKRVEPKPYRVLPTDHRRADVYQSEQQVAAALRDGTFEVRKTMYLHSDGKVYHLCYANAPLSEVV